MNFSQATQRIGVSSAICQDAIQAKCVACLQEIQSIKTESIYWKDAHTLTATTEPSLRTWGQNVTITFSQTSIEIHVESPDQVIDWFKSRKTANNIRDSIEQSLPTCEQTPTISHHS